MDKREEWLARTLVELADTLVADFDVVEFVQRLAERAVELLDAAEVGLMVADQAGHLQIMGSSTERMRVMELFELQNQEGPCLDCFRGGVQIVNFSLDDSDDRWPTFAPMARVVGYQTVHALPMRLRGEVIGALNVFHVDDRHLSPLEVKLTQALADAATIGILQERAVRRSAMLSEQLQFALNSRIAVEQGKGMLAERLHVDMEQAFSLLRGYARYHSRRLAEVADQLLRGELAADELQSYRQKGQPGRGPKLS
jgi:GAF domain-containing protein